MRSALTMLAFTAVCATAVDATTSTASAQKGRQAPIQNAAPQATISNSSRARIDVINVSPVTSDSWGNDLLGDNTLAPGRRFVVRLLPNECRYDLRVIYQDRREEERRDVDLCESPNVSFNGSGARQANRNNNNNNNQGDEGQQQQQQRPNPDSGRRNQGRQQQQAQSPNNFQVQNRSRLRIDVLNVSPVTSDNWGQDILRGQNIPPGRAFDVRLNNQTECRWDIRVIYQDRREEEQRNVDLCGTDQVAFSGENAREGQADNTPPNNNNRGQQQGRAPERQPPRQQQQQGDQQRPPPGTLVSTGTGFYITRQGHILTNRHVIEGCGSVAIARPNGARLPLRVIAEDAVNDLAVLQLTNTTSPMLTFRSLSAPVRAGDKVIVIGYPVRQLLGEINVTEGSVSAVRGPRGDGSLFQITAPVQGGNSGGPILDENGLVVGVVVARVENLPGGRPAQNINFGIQLEVERRFLPILGVNIQENQPGEAQRTSDIAERSQPSVLPLDCLS